MPKIDKQTATIQQKVLMANQTTAAATTAATAPTTTSSSSTTSTTTSTSSSPVSASLTGSASAPMAVDPNVPSPVKVRKKPGRKPNPASPALRKAQNRTAQRAFRERKERHLHELEETIKQLRMERDTRYIEVDKENLALKKMLEHMSSNQSYLMAMVMRLQGCLREHDIPLPITHRDMSEAIIVSEENDVDDRVLIKQDARATSDMMADMNAAAAAAAAAAATPIIQTMPRAASTSFEHILRSSYSISPSPPPQYMTPKESNSGYMLTDHIGASYAGEEVFDEDYALDDEGIYGLPDHSAQESYGSLLQPHMGGNYPPVQIRFHPPSIDKQQQMALEEGGVIQNGGGQFIHMQIRLH